MERSIRLHWPGGHGSRKLVAEEDRSPLVTCGGRRGPVEPDDRGHDGSRGDREPQPAIRARLPRTVAGRIRDQVADTSLSGLPGCFASIGQDPLLLGDRVQLVLDTTQVVELALECCVATFELWVVPGQGTHQTFLVFRILHDR